MIHTTNIDIYLTDILFLVGISAEEWDVFYEDNKERISPEEAKEIRADILDVDRCFGFTRLLNKSKRLLVFLREEAMRKEMYVVHECYHAVNRLLMARGVEHDISDEPFAYLLGYVVNDYFNALDDYDNENSNRIYSEKEQQDN